MSTHLTLLSSSRAQDSGYLALADISDMAARLGADYRVVGGQMVSLLVAAYRAHGAPARETADADLAAPAPVVADPRLLQALRARSYKQTSGNRFVRTVVAAGPPVRAAPAPTDDQVEQRANEGSAVLTIDVLIPSFSARHEPNQPVGALTVDAVPGLSLALARPAHALTVTTCLRDPALAHAANLPTTFPVLVPDPLSALAVKALAWASRRSPRDAVDVWRLLEVANAADLQPSDWSDTGVRGDARRLLHTEFGRRNAAGATRATSDPTTRTRIAVLVQRHVGRPTR